MPDDLAQEIADRRKLANEQQQRTPLSTSPAPTVANGGIDPIADRIASRRRVNLASSVEAGMSANPDTRARSMALAEQLQFPVDVVERNLPAVEEKARRSQYDLDAIRKNHPELADWLTNTNNAAVSNDDLPAMRAIDVATRALRGDDPSGVLPKGFLFSGGSIIEPLGDGGLANEYKTVQDLQAELLRRGERHDWQEWERQQHAQELKDRWGPLAVAGGGTEAATISTLQALHFGTREKADYLNRMADQSSQASMTLDPSKWGDFQRGLGGVAADLPLMAAGGPVARGLQALTRLGRARSLVVALEKATPANRELGGAFSRLAAERSAAKAGVAEAEASALLKGRAADIAQTAAVVQPLAIREGVNTAEESGAANGAMAWLIETAIPGAFGKTGIERAFLPGSTAVAAKGWRGVVAQGLKDAGFEASEEAITEWAHAVHEAASGMDPHALDPDRLARRMFVAGAVGGVVGGAAQIPVAIAEKMYGDQEEARRASVHADRLTDMAKAVAASKTNDRAAPVVAEAIEKSLGQSDRFQYVKAEDFRDAYADPAAAAASMGLTKEYAEAIAARTPLKIPTATLVQMAAKDASSAKLIGKARRTPDAWSAEEAAEFHDKAPDEVRRLGNEAKASAANVATTPADAQEKVRADVEAKLIKAGHDPVRAKTNATIIAREFATFAKRSGKDASDLYAHYLDGNIKKILPQLLKGEKFDLVDSMLDRIRSGEVPSDSEIAAEPAKQQIRDSLDRLAGALTDAGIDPLTATNKEARAALAKVMEEQEGKGFNQGTAVDAPRSGRLDLDALLKQWRKATGDRTPIVGDAAFEALAQRSDAIDAANGKSYQQPGGKKRRGSLVFGKTGTPFTIKLFQSENLSTFLHEGGHLSLEILGDLATADGAAPELVADYQQVRNWFAANADDIRKQAAALAKDRGASASTIVNGIENLTDEQIAGIAQDFHRPPADGTPGAYAHEAMHEYFARAFEAYLLEGKAPTASLRSAFARIKGWFTAIYRVVTTLQVNLSPEIRGVFDRLLAIEEETDAAETRAGTKDILPAEVFPDLATYDTYRQAIQASHDAVEADLQKQLIGDYQKELRKAHVEQQEEIRGEVADEVNQQPVYQAIAAFQRAELPDGTKNDAYVGMKLDRAELVREWGEAILSKLPGPVNISENDANRGAVVYATENGMSIATAAQTFGYADPSALIEAMVAAPDRRSLIETLTAKRMAAEHPDPLLDGSLPDRADQAIASDMRGELLAREIRALGMKTGQTPAPVAVLREFARDTIEKQIARDLRPDVYRTAAATASRRATEAAAKQDWGTAYVEKQREALNLEMYRAARDAVEAGEKSRAYLLGLNTLDARRRIGKAGGWEFTIFDKGDNAVASYPTADEARAAVGPGQSFRQTNGYLESIDNILDGYSLRRTSNRALRKGERLRKWVAQQQKDNPGFEIDERIGTDLDMGNVNWNDLTVMDQAEVVDAVRKVETLARLKNKLLKAKRDKDMAEAQADGASSIVANKKGNAPPTAQGDTVTEAGARSGKGFLGWHRKDSYLIRKMDGYQDAGVMWDLIQRPRNDAATEEETRNLENAAKVEVAFKKWGKGLGWTRQEIAGTRLRLTLEHRIAIALNWGHAEGRRRILRQLEEDSMDQRDVQAVLDSLDEKDFALVDDLVGIINSHWSDVAHLEQRMNGIAPDKVKALPFSTTNKLTGKVTWHEGGYYPLKYDAEKSKRGGDAAVMAALKENLSAAGARGQTRRSHTKQRVEDVKGLVVDLSLDVAGQHLAEVVHDLTHREMIRDQIQLLKDGTPIANAIIKKHGISALKQLVETTGAIATRDVQPDSKIGRVMRLVRRGNTAATFTYQLSSALMNLTGVLSAIGRVGPLRLLSAVGSVTKDAATMEWAGTWVQEKSAMMRVRGGNNVREVSEALRDIGHLSTMQKAIRIGYLPMQKVVQLVDTITWIAAYRQTMDAQIAAGKTESEADELSISVADQTVLDTQGSGRIGDLSAIQRGGEFSKMFTMFYGYFNVQANLIGEQVGMAKELGGAQWIRSATAILLIGPVATILTNLIKAALRGDERKEDWEAMTKRMAKEQLGTAGGMLVGVREVSSSIESTFGYSGPASLSAISNASSLIQDIKQGDLDGIAKGSMSTVGSLTGLPSRVANQALDAFLQFEEDGKGGRALRTLLFGKPLKDHK